MAVADWFAEFVDAHQRRHPRADWPDPEFERDFYDAWRVAFVKGGLTAEVARAASVALAAAPPAHVGQHLAALLGAAAAAFREAASGLVPGSREDAAARSRGCPECGGCGQTYRRFEATPEHGPVEAVSLGFTCLCPLGLWLDRTRREAHARDGAAALGPCLWEYPDLWEPGLEVPDMPGRPRYPKVAGSIRRHGRPCAIRHLPRWEAAAPPSRFIPGLARHVGRPVPEPAY